MHGRTIEEGKQAARTQPCLRRTRHALQHGPKIRFYLRRPLAQQFERARPSHVRSGQQGQWAFIAAEQVLGLMTEAVLQRTQLAPSAHDHPRSRPLGDAEAVDAVATLWMDRCMSDPHLDRRRCWGRALEAPQPRLQAGAQPAKPGEVSALQHHFFLHEGLHNSQASIGKVEQRAHGDV